VGALKDAAFVDEVPDDLQADTGAFAQRGGPLDE